MIYPSLVLRQAGGRFLFDSKADRNEASKLVLFSVGWFSLLSTWHLDCESAGHIARVRAIGESHADN